MKKPLRIRETISTQKVEFAIDELIRYVTAHFDFTKEDAVLVGIQTRGALLAKRIAKAIKKEKNADIPVGALDITLYRDDLSTSGIQPIVGETQLDFDLDNKQIVLIDDVLFTGRTIRAALDELMDFGRPKKISLAVLIDRGHRELPIEPEFSAIKIQTKRSESVNLHLLESDGKEEIVIGEPMR